MTRLLLLTVCVLVTSTCRASEKPNIILCMADDQGWGDTGYNGHPFLKTPHFDQMAAEGLRFDRWYAGAPVCSPTRGSCLTGRHPYRYGIFFANVGHMLPEEATLAELLKSQGYRTGHFGKWHLGTLTKEVRDSNRGGPSGAKEYSPPWLNGFDVCFSTEAKVPTYNPMKKPGTDELYGTAYWNENGTRVTENLEGDDSRVIMDRVVPFLHDSAAAKMPFFAVVWFHAPHLPVVAGPRHRAMYENVSGADPDYHGCITALDEQMGRLRQELAALGVAEHTMLWYCADNGPEGKVGKAPGSAGAMRGRKRSLFEGGVRVPGLLVWPEKVRTPRIVSAPCSTSDYLPTILDVLGLERADHPKPLDGISLLPLIEGRTAERPCPIGFESRNQTALIDNQYKLVRNGDDCGPVPEGADAVPKDRPMLFDIPADPGEKHDLAAEHPEIVSEMNATLQSWRASCKASLEGADYRPGAAGSLLNK